MKKTALLTLLPTLFSLTFFLSTALKASPKLGEEQAIPLPTTATVLAPPKNIANFSLTSTDNKPFTQANLKDHWSVLFFGYAHCKEICPKTLAVVAEVFRALPSSSNTTNPSNIASTSNTSSTSNTANTSSTSNANNYPIKPKPQFIFISLDSKQDTPEKLKAFLANFNPEFIGLTGNEKEIQNLSHSLNVYNWVDPERNSGPNKFIDHTASLLIVNPQGKLEAIISPPFLPAPLLNDIEKLTMAGAGIEKM